MFYGSMDVTKNMLGIQYDPGILRKGEFWALQDIDFEIKKGSAFGLIGQNGSGKSTLLRLINGIYPPDKGQIMVKGKIGALIAVGAGFHPHMTGRENIYLNGAILGMSKDEIDEKFDAIVKFADIGDFMDAPVATYSSGMSVRLGFSIAIHSEPEILLADEILAVGDLGFALKCYRKISEYRENGGTIMLVSHGIQLIRNTCDKVLWMDHGKTMLYGDTQSVCDAYEKFVLSKDTKDNANQGNIINTDPKVHISKVKFLNDKNKEVKEYKVGDFFNARIYYSCDRKVIKPIFTISITNPENIMAISNYTIFDKFEIESIEGKGYIEFTIDKLPLKPSEYRCTITLSENNDINNHLEWHDKVHNFTVSSAAGIVSYGIVNPFPKWNLAKMDLIEEYIETTPKQIETICKYIKKEDVKVILDIGACEGEDSIRYSNNFTNAKVYSFEPLPGNFEKVVSNITRFNKQDEIKPYNIALSNNNGESDFFVSSGKPKDRNEEGWDFGNKSSSLLKPNEEVLKTHYDWLKFKEVIKVKTKTLDSFCEENSINKIDIIHIDVQGAELLVLGGASKILKSVRFIYLEVSEIEFYSNQPLKGQIEEFLSGYGFAKISEETNLEASGDQLYINKNFE